MLPSIHDVFYYMKRHLVTSAVSYNHNKNNPIFDDF